MACNFQPQGSFCLTGSIARMHCHEGMHLLKQGQRYTLEATAYCPGRASIQIVPANRGLSELRLSPRHARQPFQDATTIYMIVIDICSLRLSQGRGEKETKAHPNKHLPCEKTSLAWCWGCVATSTISPWYFLRRPMMGSLYYHFTFNYKTGEQTIN